MGSTRLRVRLAQVLGEHRSAGYRLGHGPQAAEGLRAPPVDRGPLLRTRHPGLDELVSEAYRAVAHGQPGAAGARAAVDRQLGERDGGDRVRLEDLDLAAPRGDEDLAAA